MGSSGKEEGVLKLVHPGRHVEYHRRPTKAAEIMMKNPRHCIARPDFFENPHIVVHPESVLVPGQVFFIIPNKTIYRLLKGRNESSHQPSQHRNESPDTNNYMSPLKEWAGRTSKHQFPQAKEDTTAGVNFQPEAKMNQESNNIYRKTVHESSVDYTSDDSLTFQARDYYLNNNGSALAVTNDDDLQQKRSLKQDMNLKSCIKKDKVRALLNLRVTFDLSTMIR